MKTRIQFVSLGNSLSVFALLSLCGCLGGSAEPLPDLGEVTGVVTLDGQPLENAQVIFEPKQIGEKGRGRASNATTGADGSYTLSFNADADGASLGSHKVMILKMPDDPSEPGKQMLPAKYNEKTELTAEVKAGANSINFDLKTK